MLFYLDQYFILIFSQPAQALRLFSDLVRNHSSSYVSLKVESIFPVATRGICCIYLRNHNHLILLSEMFSFWIYSFFYLWERLKAGGEGDDRGWDGWMASLTRWTWVWARSGNCWWTGRPGMLQSMGSQSQTRLNSWTELNWFFCWIL